MSRKSLKEAFDNRMDQMSAGDTLPDGGEGNFNESGEKLDASPHTTSVRLWELGELIVGGHTYA